MPPQSLPQSSSSVLHLPGRGLFPCRFLCCSFLSCLFFPLIIPVIDFPFVTSTLTSFIFPPVACSYVLSCPTVTPSFSTVTFFPDTFLHVMFSVLLFRFPCNHPPSSQSPFLILLVTTLLLPTSLPVIAFYSIRLFGHFHLHPLHNIR